MKGLAIALTIAATALSVTAQQPPRFTTGTAAVRVDALVTDDRRPITGLTADHFELRDNGVLQPIADISRETLPLNVICVLDVSGSVRGAPLEHLKRGTTALIDALAPGDRAALVSFSHHLQIHTNLTGDRRRLRALVDDVRPGGATSVLDATFAGLALRESDAGRTLLLLFSDGVDTASWLTSQKVIDAARRTDVVIYPVTVSAAPEPYTTVPTVSTAGSIRITSVLRGTPDQRLRADRARELLERFADDTGGRVVDAAEERRVGETFVQVLSEFRQRYVLTYTPSGVAADGWHTIEVKLRGRKGQVTARRGYFAAPPTSK